MVKPWITIVKKTNLGGKGTKPLVAFGKNVRYTLGTPNTFIKLKKYYITVIHHNFGGSVLSQTELGYRVNF
jgi:hypothetical protein